MSRRAILAVLLFAVVSATRAACPEAGGIGGTGIRSEGGIGGTGIQAQSDLGIIGVVTAFGSICVNNVEIDYDAATPIASAEGKASASDLAIGQVVAVSAVGDAQRARANRIEILEAAVGPAQAFDRASGVFEVAGQRVRVDARTVFGGLPREALADNPAVRVSGLWRADGTLQATRIERAPADAAPRVGARDWPRPEGRVLIVEGYVRDAQPERLNIGGLEFDRRGQGRGEVRRDELVRAIGRIENGRPVLERNESFLRGERPERGGRGRPERPERPERSERPERPDRSGRH